MKYNATVTTVSKDGFYIVSSINGTKGILKTEKQIVVGDSINVDIKKDNTKILTEISKKGFCELEFELVDQYNTFWCNNWREKYLFVELADTKDKICTISTKNGNNITINIKYIYEFVSGGIITNYNKFIENINIGVLKKEIGLEFTYYLDNDKSEVDIVSLFSFSSELVEWGK